MTLLLSPTITSTTITTDNIETIVQEMPGHKRIACARTKCLMMSVKHTQTHTNPLNYFSAWTHTHARMHARTHARERTHTHTHTHTPIQME